MKRIRQKKIPTQKHAKMLLAKLEIDAFEGRFFDRQLEAKVTVEDCWKAWEPITTRDNDSWQSDVDRARHLVEHLGDRRAAKLTRKDHPPWWAAGAGHRRSRDRAPEALHQLAVECGTLVRNPIAGVPLLNEPNTRDMVLKPTMLERVLERRRPPSRP